MAKSSDSPRPRDGWDSVPQLRRRLRGIGRARHRDRQCLDLLRWHVDGRASVHTRVIAPGTQRKAGGGGSGWDGREASVAEAPGETGASSRTLKVALLVLP